MAGPAKPTGEAEGTVHQPAPGVTGSFWYPVAFWSLGPAASCKPGVNPPSHTGSALREEIRRPGEPGKRPGLSGCQLPYPIVPPPYPLRTPEATYPDAGRNYFGKSGDALLPDIDAYSGWPASAELPTQTEGQEPGTTSSPAPPRHPSGSDAHAVRAYLPTEGGTLPPLSGLSLCQYPAFSVPRHAQ